eukprot:3937251-Rhodomonas_salina.1
MGQVACWRVVGVGVRWVVVTAPADRACHAVPDEVVHEREGVEAVPTLRDLCHVDRRFVVEQVRVLR